MYSSQKIKNFIYHLKLIKSQTWSDPVNKGHKIELTWNYFKWIIFYKYKDKQWIINFDNGFRSIVKPFPDHDSGSMNIWTRNVDYRDLQFVRSVLKKGDQMLDIGCNVGNRTWALADLLGGSIMFDANVHAVKRAIENRSLNKLSEDKFLIFHQAIGESKGQIRFSDYGGAATNNKIIDDHIDERNYSLVEMTTIDSVVKSYNYAPVFIKIDIEGYDLPALKGARETLLSGCVKLVKFELLDNNQVGEFEDYFDQIGWKMFALDKAGKPTQQANIINSQLNLFAAPASGLSKFLR